MHIFMHISGSRHTHIQVLIHLDTAATAQNTNYLINNYSLLHQNLSCYLVICFETQKQVLINHLRYDLNLLKNQRMTFQYLSVVLLNIFTEENGPELYQRSNKDSTNSLNSTYNTTIIYYPVRDERSTTLSKTMKYANNTFNIKKTIEGTASMLAMLIFSIAFSSVFLLAYVQPCQSQIIAEESTWRVHNVMCYLYITTTKLFTQLYDK